MALIFSQDRWERICADYTAWWEGRLDRPLIKAVVPMEQRGEACPPAPALTQETCADLRWSPEEIAARMEYELGQFAYLGDAFPLINLDSFGPGVLAAFCGARLDNSSGRVWFYPPEGQEGRAIEDIHIELDEHNPWFCRVKDIIAATGKRLAGRAVIGTPDLGGALDVLATFRGTDTLLLDLYDHPEEVKRLCREIEDAWMAAFRALAAVQDEWRIGYSDWAGLFSKTPSYVPQCDFGYMIGPAMFEEFALGSIQQLVETLDHTMFHLDGTGMLPHLDFLLGMDGLQAIQWQPGDGAPSPKDWPEVYHRIRNAGKQMHVVGDFADLEAVAAEVGPQGLYHITWLREQETVKELKNRLARFGVRSE